MEIVCRDGRGVLIGFVFLLLVVPSPVMICCCKWFLKDFKPSAHFCPRTKCSGVKWIKWSTSTMKRSIQILQRSNYEKRHDGVINLICSHSCVEKNAEFFIYLFCFCKMSLKINCCYLLSHSTNIQIFVVCCCFWISIFATALLTLIYVLLRQLGGM